MSEIRLSLSDLADLMDSGDASGMSEEGFATIAAMVREDPRFREDLAELKGMARDAGVDNLDVAFHVHESFDTLMREEWEHPSDVLDEDPEDVLYEPLLHLATTLTDRAEDPEESAKYLDIERRLEAAYAVHRSKREIFEKTSELLDEVDLELAEETLARLTSRVQFRRERSDDR